MTAEVDLENCAEVSAVPRKELSVAKLRTPQRTWDGRVVPAGTTGTVVEVLGMGREYVLDFVEPYDAVATVKADDLVDGDTV